MRPIRMNEVCTRRPRRSRLLTATAALCLLPAPTSVFAAPAPRALPASSERGDRGGGRRELLGEQHGLQTIHDGGRVRVEMEMGDVKILVGSSGQVSYYLRVEGTPYEGAGEKNPFSVSQQGSTDDMVVLTGRNIGRRVHGHLYVSLEVTVPHNTPLDVDTQGGNLDVANIDARIHLNTGGGNITMGRVGGEARVDTGGGHITVQDVAGDLTATTGGGHIMVGRVHGDATLRTGGGHIRAAAVDGTANLETGGGNIFLQQASAKLVVNTGGGRIVIGKASAGMQARTGGGGIRVLRASGPTDIETGAGAIFLNGVQGNVKATTASGVITAWLATPVAPVKGPKVSPRVEGSDFESGNGDIVVYVPKNLGVNIEAVVDNSDAYRIDTDPALPLKVTSGVPGGGGSLRAEGTLNGGGPRVRVRAENGNIRLRPGEAPEAPFPFDEAKFEAELEKSVSNLTQWLENQSQSIDRYCEDQQRKHEMEMEMKKHSEEMEQHSREMAENAREMQHEMQERAREMQKEMQEHAREIQRDAEERAQEMQRDAREHAREMRRQTEEARRSEESGWSDRMEVSAEDLDQKLSHRVEPEYPERARREQLEGTVRLRVAVDADGTVSKVKILSGSALFTRAAADAVRQWRYEPTIVHGKPVAVQGEVSVTFRLPES